MSDVLKALAVPVFGAALLGSLSAVPAEAGSLQSIGEPEGVVDIVAWPGYIERGETDPNFDWVTGYEEKTGCKVRIKTAGTSDEMVALMNHAPIKFMVGFNRPYSPLMQDLKPIFQRCRKQAVTIIYRIIGESQLWPCPPCTRM